MPTLAKYRKMRDFTRTSEPRGGEKEVKNAGNSYVIQKHAARRLHYDFRLEMNGALLSWAVPKGPSLDPKVKRLAVETEPHPIEYGGFEGTIPKGEYGGGTVMVWDKGSWSATGTDAQKGYEKGHLQFTLQGEKLRGGWHLVRTGKQTEEGKSWLLFKARDEFSDDADPDLLAEAPNSALTGRSLEDIAAGVKPKQSAAEKKSRAKSKKSDAKSGSPLSKASLLALAGAKSAKMPKSIEPELATVVAEPVTSDEWVHEIDFDGQRILARLEAGNVRLSNETGEDWSARAPSLVAALGELDAESAVLDGKLVRLNEHGVGDREALESALQAEQDEALVYYVFDLLYLNGVDLRGAALLDRKSILGELVGSAADAKAMVRLSAHVAGRGDEFLAAAARLGVRDAVARRADSRYRAGPGRDWLLVPTGAASENGKQARSAKPARGSKKAASEGKKREKAREYPLTNPEKVMYPELGITKRELLDYYAMVSERMLPQVANRPLTIVRYPNGRDKHGFFQKHPRPGSPDGLRSISIRENEGKAPYSVLDDEAGLFALVQLGALEIHTWGSRADDFEHADLLVFDLDPDPALDMAAVVACAERLKSLFEQAKLESFVKTTGGKGLHVCVPIAPELEWDVVKDFTGRVAEALVREAPSKYVAMPTKAIRRGKIFIDYLRNGRGATFIAPYSTRARENAPVAVPLDWDELTPKLKPDQFNVRNLKQRLARQATDPFARMSKLKQHLRV
jgi:bifunctional non-homologous end joining protein LigD